MDSCALVIPGQSGPRHSMAPTTWQALRRRLPQARWQRYSTVSCLPPPWMRGTAGHPQPCHAHLSSIPGDLALVCQHLDTPSASSSLHRSMQTSSSQTTGRCPWQPSAKLVSLWQRLRLLVIKQLWGSIRYGSIAARPSDDPGAHRSKGLSSRQTPDAPRLPSGVVRHQALGWCAGGMAAPLFFPFSSFVFVGIESLHVYRSLPIASGSAFLTHRYSKT